MTRSTPVLVARTRLARARRGSRLLLRWFHLIRRRPTREHVRVFYGRDRAPAPGEPVGGGSVKVQKLVARFPNSPTDFSLLYLSSNWLPRDLRALLWLAGRRRIPVVLNQDGVGYRAWAGDAAEAVNRPMRRLLGAADHVVYQSEFCKRAADHFLGPAPAAWEILHNAVDVERFTPAETAPERGPVLLLGGDQYQAYRLEVALQTLAALRVTHPDAELVITGDLVRPVEPLVAALGLAGHVHLLGRYSQSDAPDVFRRAHVLLHTKVNDPCPNVVLEAMASGLPVVYPLSGGVPELVGADAGIGVPHDDTWDRDAPPDPEALADGVTTVLAELPLYAAAARARVVERFALEPWLRRHEDLFAALLGLPAPAATR